MEVKETNKFALRIPASIMAYARKAATEDGVSLNQFIGTALAEKVSVLRTMSILKERANRSNSRRFQEVMSRIGRDNPPRPDDRLPEGKKRR
jgi:uncharacterized protein (DUF1778 family)